MLAAVKMSGWSLEYASKDVETPWNCDGTVQNYGSALQYASERLKKDSKIVFEAIENYGAAILEADPMYLKNKDDVLKALKKVAHNIGLFMMIHDRMDPALKDDPELQLYIKRQTIPRQTNTFREFSRA